MFPNDWRWSTCTSSKRNRLAVAWNGASSSKGGLLSAMTVHGMTCFYLAGTVGTSEPHSLGNAMLSSWSHNARNLKQPAGSWNMIPWRAGQNRRPIMHGRNVQQKNWEKTINKVFVLSCACLGLYHLPTCASDTEGICNHKHAGCVSHGGNDNMKMTTSYKSKHAL